MSRRLATLQAVTGLVIIGVCLVGSAGQLDIMEFWEYLTVCALSSAVSVYGTDPELFKERLRPGGQNLPRRYLWLALLPIVHWCIAGLDRGRYHWSDSVPDGLQAVGVVGFTFAIAMIVWAMHLNRFFSSVIRIQAERGHHVISTGPYRWVRHPGYAAMLLACLTSGLALGSWLSIVPMLAFIPFILYRTLAEDRILKRALPGYASYAEQVRYRLFPKIW